LRDCGQDFIRLGRKKQPSGPPLSASEKKLTYRKGRTPKGKTITSSAVHTARKKGKSIEGEGRRIVESSDGKNPRMHETLIRGEFKPVGIINLGEGQQTASTRN